MPRTDFNDPASLDAPPRNAHAVGLDQTAWDPAAGVGTRSFTYGTSRLCAEEGALLLTVEGASEDLDKLEAVVGQHLVRFGAKAELVVKWIRDTGEPGTVWRNDSGVAT
jgi:hypothetical protein